ncbi:coiled-coil domain-containing protein 73-like isoform X2 [Gigantopelta aegis]|nr:coiled-coil domain-containing protein 73-like isoform X2 [Gigantopelta aegis]XP_041360467.1 coiled-coil domain-containing protein 73-like isoform X2 [Gigantopelta aegis]
MHFMEGETKQLSVYRECGEKEIKSLKDEVRNLQLSKYSLEKKIREQERLLQSQRSSAEQQLEELSNLEKKISEMNGHFRQVNQSHNRLEKNVIEAVKLNKTLMYINEHQKCLMDHHKTDLATLQTQLVEIKVRLEAKPKLEKDIHKYELENTVLKQQVKHLTSYQDELTAEVEESKTKYETAIHELASAHLLVERHLDSSEKFDKEAELLAEDRDKLQRRVGELEEHLDAIHRELDVSRETHTAAVTDWKQASSDLQDEIEKLKESLDEVKKSKMELEDLNSEWAQRNMEVTKQLDKAKEKLDVPKTELSQQTDMSLFCVDVVSTQTAVSCSTKPTQTALNISVSSTQTEQITVSWATSQTIDPALASTATQTESVSTSHHSTQIESVSTSHHSTQTENNSLVDLNLNNNHINRDLRCVTNTVVNNHHNVINKDLACVGSTDVNIDYINKDLSCVSNTAVNIDDVVDVSDVANAVQPAAVDGDAVDDSWFLQISPVAKYLVLPSL